MTRITNEAVEAAARKRAEHYESEYDSTHLKWQDFAGEAREILEAALPHLEGATPAIDRDALINAINYEFADYPEGLSFVTALDGGILPPRQVAALAADAVLALIGDAS